MSPLAAILARLIRERGPIPVDAWMAAALGDPDYGYYTTRDPLGAGGDFVTAPEVTQVFGELIGLWAAAVWESLGRPAPVLLAEVGPGRGTLIADALRAAARVMPPFAAALELHLIETSPLLRERQRDTLAAAGRDRPVTWHADLASVPDGPVIAIANELFDALPVRQLIRTETGWAERCIGLDDGRFIFTAIPLASPPAELPDEAAAVAVPGDVVEVCPAGRTLAADLAGRIVRRGGAALIIDYGYGRPAPGETLQAVRRHAFADVLDRVGETDLTAHVDFQALAEAARGVGARAWGPLPQGVFLGRLGITERAARLARGATEAQLPSLTAGVRRIISPQEMGLLFKVLAVTAADGCAPPGFGDPRERPRR